MDENNCGWAKSIRETLSSWELEQQWNKIENMNVRRLQEECHKRGRSGSELKTKTKSITGELYANISTPESFCGLFYSTESRKEVIQTIPDHI